MAVSNEDSGVASTQERRPQTEANASAQPSETRVRWEKWSEATRLEARAQQLRAELREMDRVRLVAQLKRLPPHQRAVLAAFVTNGDSELAYYFAAVTEWTGLKRGQVSRACKALRALGFLRYERGLFNDDGEVAGSGYSLRDAGRDWWRTREAPTDEGSQSASEPREDAQRRATPVLNTGEGL